MMPAIILAYGWQAILKAALLLALAAALTIGGCHYGASGVQTRWDAASKAQAARAAVVKATQSNITTEVVTQYVDRIKTVRERGADIVKEVPVYVPSNSCPGGLPGGFRLLHDAAASGFPLAAPDTDAPAVSAQDAAATVAADYAICHQNAEQLMALQAWVTRQQQVQP